MQVGFLQYSPIFGDKRGNLKRVREMLSGEKDAFIVLPELCFTGYVFKDKKEVETLAEEAVGPTVEYLTPIARDNNLYLVFGMAERVGKRLYNSSCLLSPKGETRIYRKAHLFDKEKIFFTPGDTGFPIFDVEINGFQVKVGLLICFDWIFPEPWRILALKGAQIMAHSTNLVLPYCQDAMVTRATENRVFIITANRTGEERGVRFTGRSQVVGPKGNILIRVGERVQGIWTVEFDPEEAKDKMVTERNDIFNDRRDDLYDITEKKESG
jgi:predicted amidohydrolase